MSEFNSTTNEQTNEPTTLDPISAPDAEGPNEEAVENNILPPSFELRPDGVYYSEVTPKGTNEIRLCSPMIVKAVTRNSENEEWGRLVEFFDADSNKHQVAIPMSMLSGDGCDYRARLLSLGLEIEPGRKAKENLTRYIQACQPSQRIRCVLKIGWHGSAYVLPDETIAEAHHEDVVYQSEFTSDHRYRTSGTLQEWRDNIGYYCVHNSRLIFGVSAALAAPLLPILNESGGGFHFVNPSSTGKTTTLLVSGSVCGGGDETLGFCDTWSATINALEANAQMHNHCLLCLDEIKQCNLQDVGLTAYVLANGQGKGRLTSKIALRRRFTWLLIFLSSGEIALRSLVEQSGQRHYGGQAVRFCDIPADTGKFGLFEHLHNFESPSAFANQLRTASTQYYGTPLRAWVTELAQENKEFLRTSWEIFRDEFLKSVLPLAATGEVVRSATRFALVAFAGEWSTAITGWPADTATEAAKSLFAAWLQNRGEVDSQHDAKACVRQVRYFLEQHGNSRFQSDQTLDERIRQQVGYWREHRQSGEKEFLISPEVFAREVCRNFDHNFVAKELEKRGYLKPQGDRLTQVTRVKNRKKPLRLYVISDSILEGENELNEPAARELPFSG